MTTLSRFRWWRQRITSSYVKIGGHDRFFLKLLVDNVRWQNLTSLSHSRYFSPISNKLSIMLHFHFPMLNYIFHTVTPFHQKINYSDFISIPLSVSHYSHKKWIKTSNDHLLDVSFSFTVSYTILLLSISVGVLDKAHI